MNNIFSLPRFIMLFKKHINEKSKEYLLSTATLAIIISALLVFAANTNNSGLIEDFQRLVFVFTITLTGLIFTSMIFSDLSDKRKATTYLTLPSSHLEKYLIGWIFSFFLFQIVFVAVFYIATYIVLSLGINEDGKRNEIINIFDFQNEVYVVFFIYLFAHSLMFFGALYFRKKHFIKTIFTLFLIGLSLTFLNKLFLILLTKADVLASPPFTNLRFVENLKRYYLEDEKSGVFALTLILLVTGVLWMSAFYKLKEKEV